MAQKQPASLAVNTAVVIFPFVARMGHDQRSSEPPAPPSLGEAAPGRRRGRRRGRGRGPGVSVRTRGFSPGDTRAASCPLAGSAGPGPSVPQSHRMAVTTRGSSGSQRLPRAPEPHVLGAALGASPPEGARTPWRWAAGVRARPHSQAPPPTEPGREGTGPGEPLCASPRASPPPPASSLVSKHVAWGCTREAPLEVDRGSQPRLCLFLKKVVCEIGKDGLRVAETTGWWGLRPLQAWGTPDAVGRGDAGACGRQLSLFSQRRRTSGLGVVSPFENPDSHLR